MSQAVKITIIGSGDTGTDAPSAEDFLGQVSDFLEVLKGVEKAIDDKGETHIIWRVTNAHMNSPLLVELTPYAKNPAISILDRAEKVEVATANGILAIEGGDFRPQFFSEETSKRARAIHSRVTNGLAKTTIKFNQKITPNVLKIDRQSATKVEAAYMAATAIVAVPYRELGSIEGYVSKVEQDGFGRAILRFRSRLDGEEIKAIATGEAFRHVGTLRVSEVWEGVRIRVYGVITYRDLGKIEGMQATGIEVLDQTKLPSVEDILDENFTGGLPVDQYLAALRND